MILDVLPNRMEIWIPSIQRSEIISAYMLNIEDIIHWWIKRQRLEDTRATIQAALDLLIARSEIVADLTPSGVPRYRLGRDVGDVGEGG